MNERARSIALEGIERNAEWLIYSAQEIQNYIARLEQLRSRPDFETLAQYALEVSLNSLSIALKKVQEAKVQYDAIPIKRSK